MSNELIITPVPITFVEYMWKDCIPILNRAIKLAEQDLTLDTIKSALMGGRQTLFTVLDGNKVIATALTEIVDFDTGLKVLMIPVVAGDRMDEWAERFLTICHLMADNQGCSELRSLSMRKGWSKFLKPYGWNNHITVMRCEVKQSNVVELERVVK